MNESIIPSAVRAYGFQCPRNFWKSRPTERGNRIAGTTDKANAAFFRGEKGKGGGESEQINPPRFLRARRTRGAGMEGGNGGGIKAWGRERGRESRTLELQRGNVIIWTEVN